MSVQNSEWNIVGTKTDRDLTACLKDTSESIIFYHMSQHTDKTYNKTCVTSKYSDQPVHPPSVARVLVLLITRRLQKAHAISEDWSDCTDAQADLSLRWLHKSYCRLSRVLAHIIFLHKFLCWRQTVDLVEIPHSVTSDLSIHCLHMYFFLYTVYICFFFFSFCLRLVSLVQYYCHSALLFWLICCRNLRDKRMWWSCVIRQ